MKIQHSGKLKLSTLSDREILMVREFNAPAELVWDAWTRPEIVQRWLGVFGENTMPVCEMDVRVGGRYRWVWSGPSCGEMGMGGVYKEVTPHSRMVWTEEWDQPWFPGDTLITVTFEEKDGRTICTETVKYDSKEARDTALKTPMAEGVNAGFDALDRVLAELVTA